MRASVQGDVGTGAGRFGRAGGGRRRLPLLGSSFLIPQPLPKRCRSLNEILACVMLRRIGSQTSEQGRADGTVHGSIIRQRQRGRLEHPRLRARARVVLYLVPPSEDRLYSCDSTASQPPARRALSSIWPRVRWSRLTRMSRAIALTSEPCFARSDLRKWSSAPVTVRGRLTVRAAIDSSAAKRKD